jgi:sarcosine oxidase gamma subunit
MPVGAFRPGSVARTPGYVLRTAADSLLVLVGWAFGEYLWQVVADAAGVLNA